MECALLESPDMCPRLKNDYCGTVGNCRNCTPYYLSSIPTITRQLFRSDVRKGSETVKETRGRDEEERKASESA